MDLDVDIPIERGKEAGFNTEITIEHGQVLDGGTRWVDVARVPANVESKLFTRVRSASKIEVFLSRKMLRWLTFEHVRLRYTDEQFGITHVFHIRSLEVDSETKSMVILIECEELGMSDVTTSMALA
jgi:hypothetical protein